MPSDSAFPFDIITLIIDIVGEKNDRDLLWKLSLVSHSFNQICIKYLFASIELYDEQPNSKVGFVKLLERIPEAANHIRKLTYFCEKSSSQSSRDFAYLLRVSSIQNFSNLLRTLSRLNSLKVSTDIEVYTNGLNWNKIDSSLTSAFLYLMHLPSINHIDLSLIQDFPLLNFTTSPILHRLDLSYMTRSDLPNSPEELYSSEIIQSTTTTTIREFYSYFSTLLTTKLLYAIRHDGQPAFDFTNLRVLSTCLVDPWNVRYLLQIANSLEELHISYGPEQSIVMIGDTFHNSPSALKVLGFTVTSGIYGIYLHQRLVGLCEVLEDMITAGRSNVLESLSFDLHVDEQEVEDTIGFQVQRIENVLVKPAWFALRQVSFKITFIQYETGPSMRLNQALETLPEKYLDRLSKLESVDFNYSFILSEYD